MEDTQNKRQHDLILSLFTGMALTQKIGVPVTVSSKGFLVTGEISTQVIHFKETARIIGKDDVPVNKMISDIMLSNVHILEEMTPEALMKSEYLYLVKAKIFIGDRVQPIGTWCCKLDSIDGFTIGYLSY